MALLLPLPPPVLLLPWLSLGGAAVTISLAAAGSCCLMSGSHQRGTPHCHRAYCTEVTNVTTAALNTEVHAAIKPVRCMHDRSLSEFDTRTFELWGGCNRCTRPVVSGHQQPEVETSRRTRARTVNRTRGVIAMAACVTHIASACGTSVASYSESTPYN